MTTRRSRVVLLVLLVMSACVVAEAQNTDIGILGYHVDYARQFDGFKAGSLFVEVPVALLGSPFKDPSTTWAVTPGLRFKFATQSRFSFYTSAGFGFVSFGSNAVHARTLSGAMSAAAAVDFRLTRLVSIRAEGREYLTAPQPEGAVFPGRNHVTIALGVGLHF
jgi:hypothetical protein